MDYSKLNFLLKLIMSFLDFQVNALNLLFNKLIRKRFIAINYFL